MEFGGAWGVREGEGCENEKRNENRNAVRARWRMNRETSPADVYRTFRKKKKKKGRGPRVVMASSFWISRGRVSIRTLGSFLSKRKKEKRKKTPRFILVGKKKTRQEIWEEKFFWRSCDSIVSQRDGGDHSVRKDLGQEFIYFECMSRWRRYGLDNGKGKHREIYSWDIGQQGNCDVLTGEWFRTGNPVSSATARLILQSV